MNSDLISYSHPAILQIVTPTKYFAKIAVRTERLSYLLDLGRLLRLIIHLLEYDIGNLIFVIFKLISECLFIISLIANNASLFGVLQVITMALENIVIFGLFNPSYVVHVLITMFL